MAIRVRDAVCLTSLILLAASCSSQGDTAPEAAGGRGGRGGGGTIPVVTARVTKKAMPVTLPAVGTVEPLSSVEVRAQVTGQLGAIHFSEGQDVRKGQRLFSLDARPFDAALRQAEAVLARDTATAQNAHAQKARAEDLFKRGLIPRDQFETQSASATALDATVAADKAAVDTARLNLQYAEITAPIAGRTGALGVHVGDLVRANDVNPLVVINQVSPVYVAFSVPGRHLSDIRRYQSRHALPVVATTPSGAAPGAGPGSSGNGTVAHGKAGTTGADQPPSSAGERGVVSFIDNTVDPATGTIRLKGTFPNSNRQLWPGVFVQVTLQLTTEAEAIVVPATAVQASQDGQYVYVVKPDRTVEMRPVKIERQLGDEIVLAEGVAPGDEVVTDGHLRLTPGARVSNAAGRGEKP